MLNDFLVYLHRFSCIISLEFASEIGSELTHFSLICKSQMDGLSTQHLWFSDLEIILLEANYYINSKSSTISSGYLCINQIL